MRGVTWRRPVARTVRLRDDHPFDPATGFEHADAGRTAPGGRAVRSPLPGPAPCRVVSRRRSAGPTLLDGGTDRRSGPASRGPRC